MMKRLFYILLVIVFFNVSVSLLYYLGVIKHFYNDVFEGVIINVILFGILIMFVFIYLRFMIKKFNYYKIMITGGIIGLIVSLFIPNLVIEEYIFVILFTSFSFTFIAYSIYFEMIKDRVFD